MSPFGGFNAADNRRLNAGESAWAVRSMRPKLVGNEPLRLAELRRFQ